jgi:hypothetical protein
MQGAADRIDMRVARAKQERRDSPTRLLELLGSSNELDEVVTVALNRRGVCDFRGLWR